jgi:hypothetical protein
MTRALAAAIAISWLAASGVVAGGDEPASRESRVQVERSVPSNPVRQAQMRHHFVQASLVFEAVIRGDLAAVREPALALSVLPRPSGMPETATPYLEWIRLEGRRAAEARTLERAAETAAAMLSLCGNCHSTVGVRAATPSAPRPDVGGIVGHMLEHQRAVDAMVSGLVSPSPSSWRTGAELLQSAPLAPADIPPNVRLTADLRASEVRVHAMAEDAADAEDQNARVAVFARLIATCSTCHSEHRRIWGPDSRTNGGAGR